jgi:hypothetical protein
MKQYRVTYTIDKGEGDDCVLDSTDPLYAMKEGMFLGTVPGIDVYEVYPEKQSVNSDEKINPYSQV